MAEAIIAFRQFKQILGRLCAGIGDVLGTGPKQRLPHRAQSAYRRLMASIIYKICPEPLGREAESAGRFDGAPIALADGYIHFSGADQVQETAAKHFSRQAGLLLVAV